MFWQALFGKKAPQIEADAFDKRRRSGEDLFLLDIREPVEVRSAPVQGAINIPLDELEKRVGEVPRDRPVIIMCPHGTRSVMAGAFLIGKGYANILTLRKGLRGLEEYVRLKEGNPHA